MYAYESEIEGQVVRICCVLLRLTTLLQLVLESDCKLVMDPYMETPWNGAVGMVLQKREEWKPLYEALERVSLQLSDFVENRIAHYRHLLNIKYACGRFVHNGGWFSH